MNKNLSILGLFLLAIGFTACEKKDVVEKPGFRPKMNYSSLTSASNYLEVFRDQAGNQTVDFSGQTQRQDMLAEIDSLMKLPTGAHASKGVPAAAISASSLQNMYAHTGSPFRSATLNAATDKILKGKTAASFTAVEASSERTRFDNWMQMVASSSLSFDQSASDGQAGIATANTGAKYLVDEKGIEHAQLVQKGLIGAVLMDQMVNGYLGTEKLSLDNSGLVSGKNYTAREHSWDEAYGYLTKNGVYPAPDPMQTGKYLERYLGNYVRPVGDASQLFLAFLKGRAAIVNNDETVMNQQVAIIRQHVEKAIATFAISYLNKTKTSMASDAAAAMHAFSEGAGFVYALRYGNSKKLRIAKSDELLNKLIGGARGFYSITPALIDEVRNEIANLYGIDPSTVVSH